MENRFSVMVVDEDDDTRELVTRLVERDFPELETIAFAWPHAALEYATTSFVGLLVLGARLARIGADELIREMKAKNASLRVLRVIADDRSEEATALNAMDKVLQKSRLAFDLPEAVRELSKFQGG